VGFPTGTLYNVPDLQALSLHPERIHIVGQVINDSSGRSLMQESLVIDPPEIVIPGSSGGPNPAPVPEPATLAMFLVALGGIALRRRQRRE
jgi:hypothetical protein